MDTAVVGISVTSFVVEQGIVIYKQVRIHRNINSIKDKMLVCHSAAISK